MEHQAYTKEDLKKSLIVAGILTGLVVFMKVVVVMIIRLEGAEMLGILIAPLRWLDWLLPIFMILSWSEYVKRYVYLEMWPEDGTESGKSRWRIYAGIIIRVFIGIVVFFTAWFVILFVTALQR